MQIYDDRIKLLPLQYSKYNLEICKRGIKGIVTYYQMNKNITTFPSVHNKLYDHVNNNVYRFSLVYHQMNPYVCIEINKTKPRGTSLSWLDLLFDNMGLGQPVSLTPDKIIKIPLYKALYLARWNECSRTDDDDGDI